MNSPDSVGATPEWTGVPDSQVPSRKVDLSLVRRRQARRFIPPIPLYWFNRACRLPGKALAVGMVLWRLARVKKSQTFILTQAALSQHGLGRWSKYRSLKALQEAGLISVRHRGRRNPEVTLLDLASAATEGTAGRDAGAAPHGSVAA